MDIGIVPQDDQRVTLGRRNMEKEEDKQTLQSEIEREVKWDGQEKREETIQ